MVEFGAAVTEFARRARSVIGPANVLGDPDLIAGYGIDWTGRFHADPCPVLRPGSAAEVAALMVDARDLGVGLTPQGGNTGLVGGGVALDGGAVIDMRRLDAITDVDERAGQVTAGAGTVISDLQAAARDAGWEYGVDWAARDSATVGGSVATDAGGLRFIRHGGTRRQVLGVEAVLGTADVICQLPSVEKDNTGYDLGALLCGSEGTLGLVTRARLRLVAPTGATACALLGFDSVQNAVEAAWRLRRDLTGLEAVELMLRSGIELVCSTTGLPSPVPDHFVALLLVEVSSAGDPVGVLSEATQSLHGVTSTAVATDATRRSTIWRYRELHTEAIARLGPVQKLDVTLPADALAEFVDDVPRIVSAVARGSQTWLFGHAGDGNVHVNVTGLDPDDHSVEDAVLREVLALSGSISAEHGIGRAKRRWLHLARSSADIAAMRAVKGALDPSGICNPGVLL